MMLKPLHVTFNETSYSRPLDLLHMHRRRGEWNGAPPGLRVCQTYFTVSKPHHAINSTFPAHLLGKLLCY